MTQPNHRAARRCLYRADSSLERWILAFLFAAALLPLAACGDLVLNPELFPPEPGPEARLCEPDPAPVDCNTDAWLCADSPFPLAERGGEQAYQITWVPEGFLSEDLTFFQDRAAELSERLLQGRSLAEAPSVRQTGVWTASSVRFTPDEDLDDTLLGGCLARSSAGPRLIVDQAKAALAARSSAGPTDLIVVLVDTDAGRGSLMPAVRALRPSAEAEGPLVGHGEVALPPVVVAPWYVSPAVLDALAGQALAGVCAGPSPSVPQPQWCPASEEALAEVWAARGGGDDGYPACALEVDQDPGDLTGRFAVRARMHDRSPPHRLLVVDDNEVLAESVSDVAGLLYTFDVELRAGELGEGRTLAAICIDGHDHLSEDRVPLVPRAQTPPVYTGDYAGPPEGLDGFTVVSGDVELTDLADGGLADLTLERVDGALTLTASPELTRIDAWGALRDVGALHLDDLSALEDITAPLDVRQLDELRVARAPALQSLSGLAPLQEVSGSLHLAELPGLADLDGLGGLRLVGGDLVVDDLPGLSDVGALTSVELIAGDVVLRAVPALDRCEALAVFAPPTAGELDVSGTAYRACP